MSEYHGLQPVSGGGRIIVRREPDAVMVNGVAIPVPCQKHSQFGVVLAVHAGVERPCQVRVGERVVFGKYAGSDIVWQGETVTIMAEEEIMAVLDDN